MMKRYEKVTKSELIFAILGILDAYYDGENMEDVNMERMALEAIADILEDER